MSDLPGPAEHAIPGLPVNTSSQHLAAAAAIARDNSRNNLLTTNAVLSFQPGDMIVSQTSAGDEGKGCSRQDNRNKRQIVLCASSGDVVGGGCNVGHGKRSDFHQLEPPNSNASAYVRDSQTLEWFCMRKHNKYSFQRKSKLRLVVDELGRICLARRSPTLDGANADTPLDSYGTPSNMRKSQSWISGAMKTVGKHQHLLLAKASNDPSSMDGKRSHWGEASKEEDPFQPHTMRVHAGEKSAMKRVDAVLQLGGQSVRHMVQFECVSFNENPKERFKKKTDENIHENAGASGGHVLQKSKDVAQGVTRQGMLVIKFKDGSSVQLLGMQVQDVASDLEKRVWLWEQRRNEQSASLERLVLMAKTKVSWDNPQHRQMLERFWQAVYVDTSMPEPSLHVNVSPGWKDMGFQSNDPCTDFRAMGLLSLHCLWYHSTNYPSRVRTIVHMGKPARDFPYAAVGINLVASLVQMLRLGQPGGHADVEGTALFEFFCKMPNDGNVESDSSTDAHGAKGAHKSHAEHLCAFEETFCAAYEMLDDMWMEDPPANILFFNTLLERCRELLRQLFDKRCFHSLAELRTAIRNYVPTSENLHQQPLSNASNANSDSTSSASAPITTQAGTYMPVSSEGRTDLHGLPESSATVSECAAATNSVPANNTVQDDTLTPDRAPALVGLQSVAPARVITAATAKRPHGVKMSPPPGPIIYMLDTDMAPVNYMMDTDMDSIFHDSRVVRDIIKANGGGQGPDSQHVEFGAWSLEQVDMTRILSFFGHVDQRAATDHASAGYIVQSVFDYPTPLSGSPVHPASVSPYHSSDGVHSTTNRVVSGGRGGERMREGAIRIDGAAGAVRATEIDGAGEDATASSFHPGLLDHDSDAEGDTQVRSWHERCRERCRMHILHEHAELTPHLLPYMHSLMLPLLISLVVLFAF